MASKPEEYISGITNPELIEDVATMDNAMMLQTVIQEFNLHNKIGKPINWLKIGAIALVGYTTSQE